MACMWESIRPGITVRPSRSITRACLPAIFRKSADAPVEMILPSRMATASAVDDFESILRILPLSRTVVTL